jgi:hypothetical protein
LVQLGWGKFNVWLLIALAVAIVLLLSWWHGSMPWTTGWEMISGIVDELPADEAKRKNIPIEILCMARAMRSEEGISSEAARIAVGHAIQNHARKLGLSVQTLVTRTSKRPDGSRRCPEADGRFSRQEFAKYCTTFNSATDKDVQLAGGIINGLSDDPTGGAELFDNPVLQDILAKAHPFDPETHKGYKTAAQIADARTSAGYVAIYIDGTTTRFWRKA